MRALSLLPANSGWQLEAATGVNDSGQIVGYGINPQGQTDGFLIDTSFSPEPGTLVLLCAGGVILGWARRRLRRSGADS